MPPCPMPGALMMAGLTVVLVAVQPTAHGFPAGSAAIAVSWGLIAGVICAVAPVRLSCTTPGPEAASTCDPAATTPDSAVPPPAGTAVQVVPFQSAAAEEVQTCPSPQVNSTYPTAHSPRSEERRVGKECT